MTPDTTAVPLLLCNASLVRGTSIAPRGTAEGRASLHLSLGISTRGDPRNPRFLVSHLLVRFPHRKHVNDLSKKLPGHSRRAFLERRQKNRSTRNQVLVSRKAMQNYNQSTTWQNVFTKKCGKIVILTFINRKISIKGRIEAVSRTSLPKFFARPTLAIH